MVRPMLGNLLSLCRRLAGRGAEELLQEGLIRAHRGLPGFRGEGSFRSWLVAILYRLSTEPSRFQGLLGMPGQTRLSASLPQGLEGDPLARVTARDLLHRVEEAMERLPLRQRTALHLRAVEGWGHEEIAKVLGMSRGACRMAVLEARRKLRARLGDLL